MLKHRVLATLLGICLIFPTVTWAQERGSVTNLPLPRFVSIKASEANVRRGPSKAHRVDWVFRARDLPVEITAEHGHWRRVRDRDGVGGWVHHALLSGVRTVIIETDLAALRLRPDQNAPIRAQLERNVIARIQSCDGTWCRLTVEGYRGWVFQDETWGTYPQERIE